VILAKNYRTVSKFVKVMPRILWPLFFLDTVYMYSIVIVIIVLWQCWFDDGKGIRSMYTSALEPLPDIVIAVNVNGKWAEVLYG